MQMLKKLCAILMIAAMMMTMPVSVAEEYAAPDVTFPVFFMIVDSVCTEADPTAFNYIQSASAWKQSATVAGFMSEGADWMVLAEADMETGLITKASVRIPLTEEGNKIALAVIYALSGYMDYQSFLADYVSGDSFIRDLNFTEYQLTAMATDDNTCYLEYKRVTDVIIRQEGADYNMQQVISVTQ